MIAQIRGPPHGGPPLLHASAPTASAPRPGRRRRHSAAAWPAAAAAAAGAHHGQWRRCRRRHACQPADAHHLGFFTLLCPPRGGRRRSTLACTSRTRRCMSCATTASCSPRSRRPLRLHLEPQCAELDLDWEIHFHSTSTHLSFPPSGVLGLLLFDFVFIVVMDTAPPGTTPARTPRVAPQGRLAGGRMSGGT